jgi:hypothetical protein
LCDKLNYAEDCEPSGKYWIFTNDKGLNAINLESNKLIFSSNESWGLNGTYFLVNLILENCEDPFTDFRPCEAFEKAGLKTERKGFEDLYEELSLNFDHWKCQI